ncbi:MAG TPA: hypothetical protein PKE39_04360 [Ignavibacteria bacterium]|nr:hypothetical protein [Ignavibacteria bacterium]HMQ98235.1 hypothetical protein [Ignavibacteria bacterium]
MKKLRAIINRIFSVINLLVSDKFLIMTYDHTEGSKYDFQCRSNFPIGSDLLTDMNTAVFTWVAEHHARKQSKINDDTINKILNSK